MALGGVGTVAGGTLTCKAGACGEAVEGEKAKEAWLKGRDMAASSAPLPPPPRLLLLLPPPPLLLLLLLPLPLPLLPPPPVKDPHSGSEKRSENSPTWLLTNCNISVDTQTGNLVTSGPR